jgi:nitrate reductase delta subunit
MHNGVDNPYEVLAEAFGYPEPGRFDALQEGLALLPAGQVRNEFNIFIREVRPLDLGEWEELYTRTLDLNPPAAPYIGFQMWGESYQRGTFLAKMNHELMEKDVEPSGELPDHLIPVLRYLGRTKDPIAELVDVMDTALQRMLAALRKVEPGNPYGHLLEAVRGLCKVFQQEEA